MFSTINGATDVYLILGDPVEQVRAPESFNLIFATLGINAVLVPVHLPADSVQDFVRASFC
jgi:shikimate dehydrogenase